MRLNLAVRNTTCKMDIRILRARVFQGFIAMLAIIAQRATSDRQLPTTSWHEPLVGIPHHNRGALRCHVGLSDT